MRADVKSGSAVDINIRLTNTSHHETLLGTWFRAYGNIDPAYDYICLDEKGRFVKREFPIMGDLGDHAIPVLAPGKSQEEVVTVSTACDLHEPGRYTLHVSRKYPKDADHRVVKSNVIKITVTE